MVRSPSPGLQIRLLGELEVTLGDRKLPLPPSKKTRALLGYLVLTGRSHRRTRLCSLFWDVTDDPRAALRWSLSKLRSVVEADGTPRLLATRDHVSFDARDVVVDVLAMRRELGASVEQTPTAVLESTLASIGGELFEGLELPDFQEFQAFCIAERQSVRALHARILRALLERAAGNPARALPYLRALVELDPLDEAARARLLEQLHATGRYRDAEEESRANRRLSPDASRASRETAPSAMASKLEASPSTSNPLVGREGPLARVRSVLAGEARVRALLVTGDAGLGKSRLLEEVERRARASGLSVLATRATEAEPGFPFAPWVKLLRAASEDELRPDLREELAPLLSVDGAVEAAGHGRERWFRAVSEWLRERTRSEGTLLLVDDAHWLDEPSTALLQHVVVSGQGAPLYVVASARGGELVDRPYLARSIRSLRRDGWLEECTLGALSREDTATLVRATSPSADVDEVYERSGGHPLFALELARDLSHGPSRVPASVRQLVRDRLEATSPEARDVLRWASALGPGFDSTRLERLVDLDRSTTVTLLEQLETHGWLVFGEEGACRFSHDIVRSAVYDGLSEPRRRLVHSRIARLLASEGADAAEVAHHAALGGDAPMAVDACIRAGLRCLRWLAPEDARALAKRGLAYVDRLPEPERTTREIELIEISVRASRPTRDDPVANRLEDLGTRALALDAIGHARRAFVQRAFVRWDEGDVSEVEHYSQEAERVSRRGDVSDRAQGLADAARCLITIERGLVRADALAAEAVALAEREGLAVATVPLARALLQIRRGELDAARVDMARARELARAAGEHLVEFHAVENWIDLEIQAGDLEAATRLADDLLSIGERSREGSEAPYARGLVAMLAYASGRDERVPLEPALEALALADAKHRLGLLLGRLATFALDREPTRALAWARRAVELAVTMQRPSEQCVARAVVVRAYVRLGDREAASSEADALRSIGAGISDYARRSVEKALHELEPARRKTWSG